MEVGSVRLCSSRVGRVLPVVCVPVRAAGAQLHRPACLAPQCRGARGPVLSTRTTKHHQCRMLCCALFLFVLFDPKKLQFARRVAGSLCAFPPMCFELLELGAAAPFSPGVRHRGPRLHGLPDCMVLYSMFYCPTCCPNCACESHHHHHHRSPF